MLRKSKRIISIMMVALSLICSLGMFTACKKKKSNKGDDNTTPVVAVELTADMVRLEYETVEFDRTAKEPTVTVKSGETIFDSSEYVVTYSNNTNIGTATVNVAAAEASAVLKGSVSKEFEITIATIPQIQDMGYGLYDGTSKAPFVVINGLHVGTDYTISWEYKQNGASNDEYQALDTSLNNFVEVGYYRVTAVGKGNYEGTRTAVYAIYQQLPDVQSVSSVTYTGEKQVPNVVVDGLVRGVDYEVSYEYMQPGSGLYIPYNVEEIDEKSFISAGSYRIIVTGIGLYGGQDTITYTINAQMLPAVRFEENSAVYNGSKHTPNYSVGELKENNDYEVSWQYREFGGSYESYILSTNVNLNFKDAGEYKITVKGVGNYKGTRDEVYTVEKADFEITVARENYTYNQTNKNISVSNNISQGVVGYYITNDSGVAEDYADEGWTNYNPESVIDAGTYYLFAQVRSTKNYNFSNSPVITFEVYKDELNGLPDLSAISVVYNGESQLPEIVITSKLNPNELVEGQDYYLEWEYGNEPYDLNKDPDKNFIDPGYYNVYLYAKGNYIISDPQAIVSSTYFEITSATLDSFYLTRQNYEYGSSPTKIVVNRGSGENGVLTLGATITYYCRISGSTDEWQVFTEETVLDAGTYSYYAVADNVRGYYCPIESPKATFTVEKTSLSNITLSFTTENDFSTRKLDGYDEETAQGTVTYYYNQTGTSGDGEVLTDDEFSTLAAGEYYVYAVISDMTNYDNYTTNVVKITISGESVS